MIAGTPFTVSVTRTLRGEAAKRHGERVTRSFRVMAETYGEAKQRAEGLMDKAVAKLGTVPE